MAWMSPLTSSEVWRESRQSGNLNWLLLSLSRNSPYFARSVAAALTSGPLALAIPALVHARQAMRTLPPHAGFIHRVGAPLAWVSVGKISVFAVPLHVSAKEPGRRMAASDGLASRAAWCGGSGPRR